MPNRTQGRTTAPPDPASRARPPTAPRTPTETPLLPGPASTTGPGVRLTVPPGELPEHLFRRLLSAYLTGSRRFEVTEQPHLSPSTKAAVLEFCRRTREPEVVRELGSELDLVDVDVDRPQELGARLTALGERVVEFHREAVASWRSLPLGDDGRWGREDDEIDREAWYLERCLALGDGAEGGPPVASISAWTVVRSLERIADHAVTLGEVGPRLADLGAEGGLLREIRQFHEQVMDHLEEIVHGPDSSRANDLLDVGEALIAGGRSLSERLLPAVGDGSMSPASAAAVARALEAIMRTVAYGQDIAQTFFDRTVRTAPPSAATPLAPVSPA